MAKTKTLDQMLEEINVKLGSKLGKPARKYTDKELKLIYEYASQNVSVIVYTTMLQLCAMALDKTIESTAIILERKGDDITMHVRIGNVDWYIDKGKKIALNTSLIKNIKQVNENGKAET